MACVRVCEQWANDLRCGAGVAVFDKGRSRYEGMWFSDRKHGRGLEALFDGSRYAGDYRFGIREGEYVFVRLRLPGFLSVELVTLLTRAAVDCEFAAVQRRALVTVPRSVSVVRCVSGLETRSYPVVVGDDVWCVARVHGMRASRWYGWMIDGLACGVVCRVQLPRSVLEQHEERAGRASVSERRHLSWWLQGRQPPRLRRGYVLRNRRRVSRPGTEPSPCRPRRRYRRALCCAGSLCNR